VSAYSVTFSTTITKRPGTRLVGDDRGELLGERSRVLDGARRAPPRACVAQRRTPPAEVEELGAGVEPPMELMIDRTAADLPLRGGPATTKVPTGSKPLGPSTSSETPSTGSFVDAVGQLVGRQAGGQCPDLGCLHGARRAEGRGELLHGRGLLGHVRGAPDRSDLGLEPVTMARPGALRSFSTSLGAPRIE
jgi:hypothetical protein